MKCVLEIYGNSYPSVEFSDRHVFGMVASAASGGINLKSLFERVLGDKETKESVLSKAGMDTMFTDYDMESADRNIAYILRTIFPTFDKPLNNIDTAPLILIVSAMVNALVASNAEPEKTIAPSPPDPSMALIPVRNNPDKPRPIAPSDPLDNFWVTESVKTVDVQPIDWEYPPVEILLLTRQEEEALDYAAQVSSAEPEKMRCWYSWWQTVNEGETVSTAVAIDVLLGFTQQFTEQECGRYYALVTAHIENSYKSLAIAA